MRWHELVNLVGVGTVCSSVGIGFRKVGFRQFGKL